MVSIKWINMFVLVGTMTKHVDVGHDHTSALQRSDDNRYMYNTLR
jgi:hypothetical protein